MKLVGNQRLSPEAPPSCKKGKRGESKEEVRRIAAARGAMKEGGVSEAMREKRFEEMTQLNTSSLRGSEVLLGYQRG